MPAFTCVDKNTGEVLYRGTAEDLSSLETADVTILPSLAPNSSYWSGTAWVSFPSKPSPIHVWNWTTKTWRLPALAILKALKWKTLKEERRKLITAASCPGRSRPAPARSR